MKDYLINLFSDPGFMGALLGALLTGIVGITIMFFQIKRQEKREDLFESKQLYKALFEFVSISKKLTDDIMTYIDRVEESDLDITWSRFLTFINRNIHMIKDEYSKIDDNLVVAEIYPTYLNIKITLSVIETYLQDLFLGIEEDVFKTLDLELRGLRVTALSLSRDIERIKNKVDEIQNKLEFI